MGQLRRGAGASSSVEIADGLREHQALPRLLATRCGSKELLFAHSSELRAEPELEVNGVLLRVAFFRKLERLRRCSACSS